MLKTLSLAIGLLLLSTFAYCQTAEEKLSALKGQWQTSKDGFLQYKRTVQIPGLNIEDIAKRAREYYQSKSYENLTQPTAGPVILLGGTGTFKEVQASESNGVKTTVDATHYLHVASADGKAEIVITCLQYLFHIGSGSDAGYDAVLISTLYPVNAQAPRSDKLIDAFLGTTQSATARLDEIEKALKEGKP
ncbi:hypothetical protein [Telluribacter sp.]|jgi:hypothetical protein|uniref:hypothetical protein n=1 Tax=Telluribacter sp. TaxID=1978767 RepID=UPI002E13A7D3|nr:hypothetical protein [Telluribacter sp.]